MEVMECIIYHLIIILVLEISHSVLEFLSYLLDLGSCFLLDTHLKANSFFLMRSNSLTMRKIVDVYGVFHSVE